MDSDNIKEFFQIILYIFFAMIVVILLIFIINLCFNLANTIMYYFSDNKNNKNKRNSDASEFLIL